MRKLILFITFMVSLQAFSAAYLKVIYIADHKTECGTKKCYLIRDTPTDTFTVFDKEIEGFSYEEGFEYCLLIEVQTPGISEPAVPFDSSQVKYVLSEIKSKTRKNNADTLKKTIVSIPDSSKWTLYKLRMKDGSTKTFTIQKAFLQFNTGNNIVNGNTECNTFNAGFSADSTSFKFDNIVTTKMACGKHSIEPVFLDMLQKTTSLKITSKLLYLFKGKTLLGLFTRKK